jgi:hypothetical protein
MEFRGMRVKRKSTANEELRVREPKGDRPFLISDFPSPSIFFPSYFHRRATCRGVH